jgi:DNA polymerase-1
MATIDTDAPTELDTEACELKPLDREKVLNLFRELEFRSLVGRLPDWLPPTAGPPSADGEEQAPAPAVVEAEAAKADYRSVHSEEELERLARRLAEAGSFAFDTETTALGAMQAGLVGISLSPAAGEAYYIPVGHRPGLGEKEQLPLSTVLKRLGPVFEDATVEKVAHNGKFDILVLANQGVWTENLAFDTMIAAYVLGEGGGAEAYRPGAGSLSLKWLASKRLGVEMTPITDLIGPAGPKQISMDQAPVAAATAYACADADMTGRLRTILARELREQGLWSLFAEIEMPLVPVLARMEQAGVALDTAILREMSRQLEGQVREVEDRVYAEVGHRFNIGSPQQLSSVLFDEIKLPKTRRTKYGYTTDAQALEALRGAHPVIDLILLYRQLTKLKSTYVDTLPALINPKTGRVHTTFNQTVTATGRLSSNDPNLQNIPVRTELGGMVRSAFVARDIGPDPWLLAADYSQIELRILAHVCQDPNLLEAFRRDEDIHASTASQVFGVPIDRVTPEMRRRAKVFNFGVLYGLTDFGLSQREGISREEAAQFIQTYYQKYERVRRWQEEVVAETRRLGYAETLAGRRRYIPEINSSNFQARAAAERMAVNMPIQGTASDIIKIAMNRIDAELRERGFRSKMLLQVHDELIFEGPASELDGPSTGSGRGPSTGSGRGPSAGSGRGPSAGSGRGLREMVLRVMPQSLSLAVPLKVDVKVGRNWGEME